MFKLADLFVAIGADDGPVIQAIVRTRLALISLGQTALNADPFKNWTGSLGGVEKAMTRLDMVMSNMASIAIMKTIAAVKDFASAGIGGAVGMVEAQNKVTAIYGESAGKILGFADEMATKYGLVKQPIIDIASKFGLMFQGAGQARDAAADLGVQFAKMAVNAHSFFDVDLETAMDKIASGLTGHALPMREFGVLLSEDAVKSEALRLKLVDSTKDLDDNSKMMARASLIAKGLSITQDDLARTADSPRNQWIKFTGTIQNAAVSIATDLMPAISSVVSGLSGMATGLAAFIADNKATIKDWSDNVVMAVKVVGVMFRNLGDVWAIVQIKFREMSTNFVAILGAMVENGQRLANWFGRNWVHIWNDAFMSTTQILINFGKNIKDLAASIETWLTGGKFVFNPTPLLQGFKATTEKLPAMIKPAFIDLQAEIDKVGDRMAGKESKLAEGIKKAVIPPAGVITPAAEKIAKAAQPFRSDVSSGEDAYFALRKASQEGADDTPKKQLETQTKILTKMEKMADQFANAALKAFMG